MARAAEIYANQVIVTNDNPRREDPQKITDDIFTGFRKPEDAILLHDRAQAIAHAIHLATQDDIVLIAGKGHEAVQLVGDRQIPFDDREQAMALLGEDAP